MVCQMLISQIGKSRSKHHGLESGGGGEDTILNHMIIEGFTIGQDPRAGGEQAMWISRRRMLQAEEILGVTSGFQESRSTSSFGAKGHVMTQGQQSIIVAQGVQLHLQWWSSHQMVL